MNRIFVTSLVSLVIAGGAAADEFDLYYLGGQSNMEGFGTNSELELAYQKPVEGAWIYHSTAVADQQPALGLGHWELVRPGHGSGFSSDGMSNQLSNRFGVELSFAAKLRERRPNRKIAIIKYARNGSSIAAKASGQWGCWEPDFQAENGQFRDVNQYDQFFATLRNSLAIEDIDGDGTKDRLVPAGILWMQGESDAVFGEEIAVAYENNLKRLMDLLRAALRANDMPIAIGRISDSKIGTSERIWKFGDLVRASQASFVSHDRAAKLVTDTDNYDYSDPYHYDSKGYVELGKRFADALLSIPKLPSGGMFADDAKLKVEVGNGAGGEGPAWDSELGVLTSGNGNINRLSLEGVSSVFREGAGTNGLLFDSQRNLLACEPKLRRVTRTDRTGKPDGPKITVLTDSFGGKKYNQPNDLTVDSKGRIYFSDPYYGNDRSGLEIHDAQGETVEGVYRIDVDGKVSNVIRREVDRANGVLVSLDDKYLLVADNNNNTNRGGRKLWRFELQNDGSVNLKTARILFDWGNGRGPDGLKQDTEGNLYVAAGLNRSNPPFETDDTVRAGIYVLDIEGILLDFVPVPTDEVTNCAFGGADMKTLYITGGGTLYSIRTKNTGRSAR